MSQTESKCPTQENNDLRKDILSRKQIPHSAISESTIPENQNQLFTSILMMHGALITWLKLLGSDLEVMVWAYTVSLTEVSKVYKTPSTLGIESPTISSFYLNGPTWGLYMYCLLWCTRRLWLLGLWMKFLSVTIQMKAIEQYFPVQVLFIMLYKLVITFEQPLNNTCTILKCDHSNKSCL